MLISTCPEFQQSADFEDKLRLAGRGPEYAFTDFASISAYRCGPRFAVNPIN